MSTTRRTRASSSTAPSLPLMAVTEPPDRSLGIICDNSDYQLSQSNGLTHCLTRGQSIGLAITAETSLLSLLAVLLLFAYIVRNMIIGSIRSGKGERLIKGPADVYMLSLLCSDLIQATGTSMDIKWIQEGKVEAGHFCTAQGVVEQLGETTVAMHTLALTIHTFLGIWFGNQSKSLTLPICVVSGIWLFVTAFVAITVPNKPNYETPTPFWCWIGSGYMPERIAGEYVWFWCTLAVSFALYIPLFFFKRGNIKIHDPTKPWKVSFRRRSSKATKTGTSETDSEKEARDDAYDMLAYPLTYSIIILPLSIVRWITFSGHVNVPSAGTFFIIAVYCMSGFTNVLLLVFTRPGLLTFGRGDESMARARERRSQHTPLSRVRVLPSVESLSGETDLADIGAVAYARGNSEHDFRVDGSCSREP